MTTTMELTEREVELVEFVRLSPAERLAQTDALYKKNREDFLATASPAALREAQRIETMNPEQRRIYSLMKLRDSIAAELSGVQGIIDEPEVTPER